MRRIVPWLLVLLWASVMFNFSTGSFSKDNTSFLIVPILQWLLPHASYETIDTVHELIRKSAHVFEYSVLTALLFRAVRAPAKGWTVRWAGIALFLTAVFAASDEFHQTFVPSRGASVWDVLLDTTAAAAAQLILWLWLRRNTPSPSDAR
jgi:VanZ family protein